MSWKFWKKPTPQRRHNDRPVDSTRLVIATTHRRALLARNMIFGEDSRIRVAGAEQGHRLMGYRDATILIEASEDAYEEEVYTKILPCLEQGNRVFWFSRSLVR